MYYDCSREFTTGNDVRQVGGWEGWISFKKSLQKKLTDVAGTVEQATIAVCHLAYGIFERY